MMFTLAYPSLPYKTYNTLSTEKEDHYPRIPTFREYEEDGAGR